MPPRCCVDLAKAAKDEKYQRRAVRGYIRLARQFAMTQADREAMCRTALEIAQRPDDKRLVLEILLRYPSPEMLALALEAAKVPELKDEATMVALGIGQSHGGDTVQLRKALAQAGHQAVKLEILKAEYGAGRPDEGRDRYSSPSRPQLPRHFPALVQLQSVLWRRSGPRRDQAFEGSLSRRRQGGRRDAQRGLYTRSADAEVGGHIRR